jgi:hypothetical protein
MFDARQARAAAQHTTQLQTLLLAAKRAVIEAAAEGKFRTLVALDVEVAVEVAGPVSVSTLTSALRNQGHSAAAEMLAHAQRAGYRLQPVVERQGRATVRSLELDWFDPGLAQDAVLLMPAALAQSQTEAALAHRRWAAPLLQKVAAIAGQGATHLRATDRLELKAKETWAARRELLEGLGFTLVLQPHATGAVLLLSW